jgi:hypothetical protein
MTDTSGLAVCNLIWQYILTDTSEVVVYSLIWQHIMIDTEWGSGMQLHMRVYPDRY